MKDWDTDVFLFCFNCYSPQLENVLSMLCDVFAAAWTCADCCCCCSLLFVMSTFFRQFYLTCDWVAWNTQQWMYVIVLWRFLHNCESFVFFLVLRLLAEVFYCDGEQKLFCHHSLTEYYKICYVTTFITILIFFKLLL